MFDYAFLKIINANNVSMLDAIEYALKNRDYDITKAQLAQLLIVCGMQKSILLLKEQVELQKRVADSRKELNESYSELMDFIGDKLKTIKVDVTPIEKRLSELHQIP